MGCVCLFFPLIFFLILPRVFHPFLKPTFLNCIEVRNQWATVLLVVSLQNLTISLRQQQNRFMRCFGFVLALFGVF